MFGAWVYHSYGFSAAFLFTPEVGVRVMANHHSGVQVSVALPIAVADGSANMFKLFVGYVYRR